MLLDSLPLASSNEPTLVNGQSRVLRRDATHFEVWGENISDHYLISFGLEHTPPVDVVLLISNLLLLL